MSCRESTPDYADSRRSCNASSESQSRRLAAHRSASGDLADNTSRREGSGAASCISRYCSASAQIRFVDTKSKVDYLQESCLPRPCRDDNMPVEWEECFEMKVDPDDLENEADGRSRVRASARPTPPSRSATPPGTRIWSPGFTQTGKSNCIAARRRRSAPAGRSRRRISRSSAALRLANSGTRPLRNCARNTRRRLRCCRIGSAAPSRR